MTDQITHRCPVCEGCGCLHGRRCWVCRGDGHITDDMMRALERLFKIRIRPQ